MRARVFSGAMVLGLAVAGQARAANLLVNGSSGNDSQG